MTLARGSFDHMVTLHHEAGEWGESWWAECGDFPGFSAAADTYDELMRLVGEFLREEDGPDVRWYAFWTGSTTGADDG